MWPICHHLRLLKICVVDLCDLSIYHLVAKSYQSFQRPMRGEETFFIPVEFLFVAVNNLCCFGLVFFLSVCFFVSLFANCCISVSCCEWWNVFCKRGLLLPFSCCSCMHTCLMEAAGISQWKLQPCKIIDVILAFDSIWWIYVVWARNWQFLFHMHRWRSDHFISHQPQRASGTSKWWRYCHKGVKKVGLQGFTV